MFVIVCLSIDNNIERWNTSVTKKNWKLWEGNVFNSMCLPVSLPFQKRSPCDHHLDLFKPVHFWTSPYPFPLSQDQLESELLAFDWRAFLLLIFFVSLISATYFVYRYWVIVDHVYVYRYWVIVDRVYVYRYSWCVARARTRWRFLCAWAAPPLLSTTWYRRTREALN